MMHKLTEFLAFLHGACIVMLITLFPVTLLYPTEQLYWFRAAAVIVPLAVSDYGIRHLRRLSIYLLLCIICTAGIFFFAKTLPEMIYLPAVSLLVFAIRIPARIHRDTDLLHSPALFALIAFIIVYIMGLIFPSEPLCMVSYPLAFCYLIILILHTNLSQLSQYLDQNRNIANLPGHRIMTTNRIMMMLFMFAALLSMILVPATGIAKIFPYIGNGILWLLRTLFSLLPDKDPGEIPEPVPEAPPSAEPGEMLPIENQGPTLFTMILNILAVILIVVMIAAAVAGVIYAIIMLFRHFYQPIHENDDKQEFIKDEKADISAYSHKEKKEPSLFFQFDPSSSVRKLFIRSIRKGIQNQTKLTASGSIPEALTPSELEQLAGLSELESTNLLHELYEKARYSPEPCTKEEVALLKAALSKQ